MADFNLVAAYEAAQNASSKDPYVDRDYWAAIAADLLKDACNFIVKQNAEKIDQPRAMLTEEQRDALEQAVHICHEVTAFDVAEALQSILDENRAASKIIRL